MKNTGVLIANDVKKNRLNAVVGNFHRLGVVNSIVSCCDGRKFHNVSRHECSEAVLNFLFLAGSKNGNLFLVLICL